MEEEQFSKFLYAYYFITITIVISNRLIGFRKVPKFSSSTIRPRARGSTV